MLALVTGWSENENCAAISRERQSSRLTISAELRFGARRLDAGGSAIVRAWATRDSLLLRSSDVCLRPLV